METLEQIVAEVNMQIARSYTKGWDDGYKAGFEAGKNKNNEIPLLDKRITV